MSESFRHYSPYFFPVFFVLMWLFVTTLLGFISGWYTLMRRFPDHAEGALRSFTGQSGSMNFVGMRSILKLSVCASGLRIGITRIFGLFCRDCFVPWDEISVSREDRWLRKVAKLSFGIPRSGSLTIPSEVADRIARAAGGHWPEAGSFPPEPSGEALSRIIKQWLASTGAAAAFFIIMPRLMIANEGSRPPVLVAILFPAAFFGVVGLVQYFRRERD